MTRIAPPLLLAFLATVALSSTAVTAAPKADVASAFGNTVLSVDPDGRSRKIWLQPDGSWTGKSRRGIALAGKWIVKGDRVCLSQSKPRLFGSFCEVFPTDPKAGIVTTDPTGTTVHLKLVKGHFEG